MAYEHRFSQCSNGPIEAAMIDYRDVSIFITNKNRLDVGFRDQITWWLETGMTDITVLDNGSTYPPLLKFYERLKAEYESYYSESW